MVDVLQGRATRAPGHRSAGMVAVIAFSLFLDYFFYGLLFPLSTHSPAKLAGEEHYGLLYGAYAVSVLLVTPVFGYLGDRIGGRKTMLYGVTLAACAIVLCALASSFSLLLLAKVCQGAASAALWTSGLTLIATNYVVNRVEMLGYAFTGGTFGSVIGPIAGGSLYHAGGYKMPFLVTEVLFIIDGALIFLFLPAGRAGAGRAIGFRSGMLNKSVVVLALAVALAAFSVGVIEPLLPVRLARDGATSTAIGVIFTVSTLAYGLCAPVVGRVTDRVPIKKVIVPGTIAMAVTLPLLAVFSGGVLVCIVLSLVNASFAFMLNPASDELGNVVDRTGRFGYSAVYAVYNICYSIGMLGTALLASVAVRLLDFWGVLLCASAILLLSVPILTMADLPENVVTASTNG